jgi:small subunit ribosomal protein S16
MVKTKLTRRGRKEIPFYRIVVIDSKKARDSNYVEKVGY